MSESGDDSRPRQQGGRRRGGGGGSGSDEKEIDSKQVVILSKRFYIDVKENKWGRFVKLAEVGTGGRRSRLLMSMAMANQFKTKLAEFGELHASMGPTTTTPAAAAPTADGNKETKKLTDGGGGESGGLIKSETLVSKERKRYYLDFKENQRGRFLRVSMVMPRGSGRAFLAIPAEGLLEFKDHLSEMIDRHGAGFLTDDETAGGGGGQSATAAGEFEPESKSLRVDKKMFYFDSGANERGVFLKVSEVRNRYRSSITIPDNVLLQFRDLLNEYADKIGVVNNTNTSTTVNSSSSNTHVQSTTEATTTTTTTGANNKN